MSIIRRSAAGVIFFNNTGYLGMCGHGAIGVAAALAYQQRLALGNIKLETPVGVVGIELTTANTATVENVASYCYKSGVEIDVEGLGMIRGDIAWGGNWLFLVDGAPCPLNLANEAQLTRAAIAVKKSLQKYGVTGANGAEIDHIEFIAPPESDSANSRNFVLCPGDAYDRSPCGTGTSAKLACLAQRGMLGPGEQWIQESVIGSRFTTSYQRNDAGESIPSITGRAFVCGETSLIFESDDPFAAGIV